MVITMSDPVTNVEIEDVLSSIRRLVSEEGRDKPRKRREPDPAVENRLVLTPALRIAEREDEPSSSAPEVVSEDANAEADIPVDLSAEFSDDAPSDEIEFHETQGGAEGDDDAVPPEPDEAPALLDVAWITEEATVEPFVLKARSDDEEMEIAPAAVMPDADGALDELVEDDLSDVDEDAAQEESAAVAEEAVEEPDLSEPTEAFALETPPPFIRAVPDPDPADEDAGEMTAQAEADTEAAPWSDPDTTLHEAAARAEEPEITEAEDADSLPKGERMRRAAMLSAKIQALEAAIAETPDQWEPDGASADDYAGTEVDGLAWQQNVQDDLETQASESHEESENAEELPSEPAAHGDWLEPEAAVDEDAVPDEDLSETEAQSDDDDFDLSEPVEADLIEETDAEAKPTGDVDLIADVDVDVEEALAESIVAEILPTEDMGDPEAFELDTESEAQGASFDGVEFASHEVVSDADDLEAEADVATPPLSRFAVEELEDADTLDEDEMASADAFLDEDMLRELVGQIVRQELQGALGERITRNVRKLVRREIHRAMTTQDLD